ncbi:MAG: hypothetical protein P8X42_09845 [Calditrichaceae bacterium]
MYRLFILLIIFLPLLARADIEDCLMCHEDPDLVSESGKTPRSVYVDISIFQKSVHADFDCIACHTDVDVDDLPHPTELQPVFCGSCHDDLLRRNVPNATANMIFCR